MSKRRKVERETPEFAQMVARMIRAHGRRVAEADEVDLADLVAMRRVLEDAIADAVAGQQAAGKSWAEIARGLGVKRQTAHERYGRVADRAS